MKILVKILNIECDRSITHLVVFHDVSKSYVGKILPTRNCHGMVYIMIARNYFLVNRHVYKSLGLRIESFYTDPFVLLTPLNSV